MATNQKHQTPMRVTPLSNRDDRTVPVPHLNADRVSSIIRLSEEGDSTQFWRLASTVLLQDNHIQGELSKRKLAVLGDQLTVSPWDRNNPADVEAADAIEELLLNHPNIFACNEHLMNGTIFPLAIVEKVFAPADPAAPKLGRRVALKELVSVPYRLVGWNTNGQAIVTDRERGGFTDAPALDANRYMLHRGHMLSTPDRFGGPMRSIFWLWLLSSMSLTWWARYLERFGAPFIVGRVDSNDPNDRSILESAISYATQLGGLVVSSNSQVDLKEATKDSGAGFAAFRDSCRLEISRLILGQTLSSTASSTGMGSGTADLQGEVRNDIRKFDTRTLCETLRTQLVTQWLTLNGYTGTPPVISFAEDTTEEVKRTADLLQSLAAAGFEPTDNALDGISERIGFPIQRKASIPQGLSSAQLAAAQEVSGRAFFRREIKT